MKAWLVAHALQLVLGPAVGVLSFIIHEKLQTVIAQFNAASPLTKRIASVLFVSVLTALTQAFGVALPDTCGQAGDIVACLTSVGEQSWLGAALAAAAAEITHRISKAV